MKKIFLILGTIAICGALSACGGCEKEPIVEQNRALIVPPGF